MFALLRLTGDTLDCAPFSRSSHPLRTPFYLRPHCRQVRPRIIAPPSDASLSFRPGATGPRIDAVRRRTRPARRRTVPPATPCRDFATAPTPNGDPQRRPNTDAATTRSSAGSETNRARTRPRWIRSTARATKATRTNRGLERRVVSSGGPRRGSRRELPRREVRRPASDRDASTSGMGQTASAGKPTRTRSPTTHPAEGARTRIDRPLSHDTSREDRPREGREVAAEQFQECRLAAARRAEQREERAGRDREGHVPHGEAGATGAAFSSTSVALTSMKDKVSITGVGTGSGDGSRRATARADCISSLARIASSPR